MKYFSLLFVLAALALALFLTGCKGGGGDDDDSAPAADDDATDDTQGDDAVDDDTADDDTLPVSPVIDHAVDETINIPGLTGAVRVALDAYGIPYIFAENELDLARASGYMQAEQRFFQMDFLRHLAEGRLTEYVTSIALPSDIYYRMVFMGRDGRSVLDAIVESMDADTLARGQAFADGVNAWLKVKRQMDPLAGWPSEYVFFGATPENVPDWQVRDTVSIARYQVWDLSQSLETELSLTKFHDTLAGSTYPNLYDTVFPRGVVRNTTVLPPEANRLGAPLPYDEGRILPQGYHGLDRALNRVREMRDFNLFSKDGQASNNWVISPSINNGVGYLANDPHLALAYPSVFHLGYMDTAEFAGEGRRTRGAIIAGAPAVIIGANETLAWGETVAGYDVLDVYAEQLVLDGDTPTGVTFNGDTVALIPVTEEFVIPGHSTPETVTLYVVPHHGPIMPDSIEGSTALSFRWTGHESTVEVKAFTDLNAATTVDEGFTALDNFQVGAQNFILQDTNGDIGYYPNGLIPNRPWAADHKPWHVLPGDGSAEWDGYIPHSAIPQVKNPSRGFLLTSNNDINGTLQSGDPTAGEYYWYFERDSYRAARVDALLSGMAPNGFTMNGMKSTQLDVLSLYASDLISRVLTALGADVSDLSADAQEVVQAWNDWGFETDSGLVGSDPQGQAVTDAAVLNSAVAATAFGVFEPLLKNKTFGDELAASNVTGEYGWDEWTLAILRLMDSPDDPIWDDVTTVGVTETQRDIVVAAIEAAVQQIPQLSYSDPSVGPDLVLPFAGQPVDQWLWGRIHHVVLEHMAFAPFGIDDNNKGPWAIPGGLYTVDVAGYDEDGANFTTTEGPSLRFISEFTGGQISVQVHFPGGQVPVAGDPNELDMMQKWLSGDYYEMPGTVSDILAATVRMIAFESN